MRSSQLGSALSQLCASASVAFLASLCTIVCFGKNYIEQPLLISSESGAMLVWTSQMHMHLHQLVRIADIVCTVKDR